MNKIQTAEEFLITKNDKDFRLSKSGEYISDLLIEFAKLKVIEALKEASEKATVDGCWEKPDEAINSIEKVIDAFLKDIPKTYKELAKTIQASLIWTGYEDCYVESKTLKILIENFMLVQPKKL